MTDRWREQSRAQWDEKAKDWHKKSFAMWHHGSRKPIVPAVRTYLPSGSSLLDVGCGDGTGSNAMGAQGYKVTGLDLSKEMIQYAKHQSTSHVQFYEGTIEDFALNHQSSYDSVMCINSLEWMENPFKALKTIDSLVTDNGKIFCAILGPTAGPRSNSFDRLVDGNFICNTMMPWEFQGLADELNWHYLDEVHVYKDEAVKINKDGLSNKLKQSLTFYTLFVYEKKKQEM
ncbi:class I SAM-dependent methyltransferase [Jeotgalibacillus campisalis]|uniref:Methyltransferase type 11 domain-containing protein n=1 Tax=Jeotgalibacillus campisalis TaxID=220754 RepID=A0A0C2S1X2_9BACL|nr:class I SAM-dependent methyltransferase [Jeotgalibacillus campisalis]KIL47999.1 hypothetical protein KR50_21660 [Jeotgalibacillus campisalis]